MLNRVGSMASSSWAWTAILTMAFCSACSDQKYDLLRTNVRLHSFSNYVETLSSGDSSSDRMSVSCDGRYPPNVSEQSNGAERFLIAPEFRVSPFVIRTVEEQQHLDSEVFMVEAFRSPWTNVHVTQSQKWLIQYISSGEWYILVSCGPDGKYESEVLGGINRDKKTIESGELQRRIEGIKYDPTNGTDSRGDVIRTSF